MKQHRGYVAHSTTTNIITLATEATLLYPAENDSEKRMVLYVHAVVTMCTIIKHITVFN